MGVGGQRHAPAALLPVPGTHCIEGWVGPRAGLDGCGKISPPQVCDAWTDRSVPTFRRVLIPPLSVQIRMVAVSSEMSVLFGRQHGITSQMETVFIVIYCVLYSLQAVC
jgi:hypothetical protein